MGASKRDTSARSGKKRETTRAVVRVPAGVELPHRTDLARLDRMTDADIARGIRDDPDAAPEFTDEMVARARVLVPPPKVPISIRIDRDVLEFFRGQGPHYQRRMNAVLRGFMEATRRSPGTT